MQKREWRATSSVHRDVAAGYDAQQAENHAEEMRRRDFAARADPKIARLLNDRVNLFRKYADAAFSKPENAMRIAKTLQKKMADLQSELRARLLAAGFNEDYLQPVYQCALCRDTGFVGEPVRERCACFFEQLQKQIAAETDHGLNPNETFAAYDETVYTDTPMDNSFEPLPERDGIGSLSTENGTVWQRSTVDSKGKRNTSNQNGESQRAYTARLRNICFEYASLFPNNSRKNLLFLGKSGLGKTYLMNCIGNAVMEKGVFIAKCTAYQLTERMRAMVFERAPEAMAPLIETPLLLLDDLGVEPLIPNITIEQLFALINERELRGLHTVISSNLYADELKARYTERITSRLYDRRTTATLVFKGQDVRLRR